MIRTYLTIISFLFITCFNIFAENFYGYYTRLNFEDGISGRYADIIVSYGDKGRIVFSRESSYLPKWETSNGEYYFEEVIKRVGDGSKLRPDKYNRHAYVRIIKNNPEKVLVHWRYYPHILKTEMTDVVHEFFTFTPDGKVKREIKVGTKKIDEWNSLKNTFEYELNLKVDGIEEQSYDTFSWKKEITILKGNPVIKNNIADLAAYWSFDEGMINGDDYVKESVTNIDVPILGHKSYWSRGVSGTALKFDGYFSGIELPVQYAPRIRDEFTIEAWVNMAAHPFGWVPIVHQSNWKEAGYYLGVNAYGQIGFLCNLNGQWKTFQTDEAIDIHKWTHLAVSLNSESDKLNIYINGEIKVDTLLKSTREATLIHANAPLSIGLNTDPLSPLPRERFSYGQYPSITGFEGAIDEIKFYYNTLEPAQIARSYATIVSQINQDEKIFEKRILPGFPGYADKFSAIYTKLTYHSLWDNAWRTSDYPDILVKFDELPTSVTFWRGPSYGAGWVTDKNLWMLDQSVETGNAISYVEHMSDKQGRYSHVRLIENTDARVVIHWRYSSNDVLYSFHEAFGEAGLWIDEYMTIYPDGVGIRKVEQKAVTWDEDPPTKISWQDVQFAAQPGMTPDDVMNLEAVHLADMRGQTATMDWTNGVPRENPLASANIELINFKSDYKVFLAFQDGTFINPWGRVRGGYCHFMTWNHWPVAFIHSQGKSALFPTRVTHSALCAADNAVDHGNIALYGFTNQSVEKLIPLVKSWNFPAGITNLKNCESLGYDKDQKAFIIKAVTQNIEFYINANASSPLVNPCFVIKNWNSNKKSAVIINGKSIAIGKENRQGIVYDTDGKEMLIVWLKLTSAEVNHFEIRIQ